MYYQNLIIIHECSEKLLHLVYIYTQGAPPPQKKKKKKKNSQPVRTQFNPIRLSGFWLTGIF